MLGDNKESGKSTFAADAVRMESGMGIIFTSMNRIDRMRI
jgi:hypothetical protein